jgi:SAM-dependent methyltransferase
MTTLEEVRSPAEIYDAHFVPALFAQWGPIVAAEAEVQKGDRVLDVACGTGALTLAAAEIAGLSGSVVGLDANPEMLAVARRKPAQIEWLEGTAEALPLPDNSFDAGPETGRPAGSRGVRCGRELAGIRHLRAVARPAVWQGGGGCLPCALQPRRCRAAA